MSNEALNTTTDLNGKRGKKSLLRFWIFTGFLLVFVGFLVLSSMYSYDGRAVQRVALWNYYYLEIQRAADSTGHLGPTSQNASDAMMVALQHIAISLAGGAVFLVIGWFAKKWSHTS